MAKYRVQFARLVRETRITIVESPSIKLLEDSLKDLYECTCEFSGWRCDKDWGDEEGKHIILDESVPNYQPAELEVDAPLITTNIKDLLLSRIDRMRQLVLEPSNNLGFITKELNQSFVDITTILEDGRSRPEKKS